MAKEALFDVKIIDLTHYVAGPYCTKLMADMGADVLKIEPPDEGDGARRMGPFPEDIPDPEKSGLFLYLNTNKKGITLNLKSEMGRNIFKELVSEADILVENFEPRVMASLGLSYESLEKINPSLVMTSISNFGQTGPYRDYKAIEINLAALGGTMYLAGNAEHEPLTEQGAVYQFAAGSTACAATLAAYYAQLVYDIGQHVDVSILETIASCLGHNPIHCGRTGLIPKRSGPYSQATAWPGSVADSGIYPCKDGFVLVSIRNEEDLSLAAVLTGKDEILTSNIHCVGFGKVTNGDTLNRLLLDSFKDRDKNEIFHTAQEMRLFWTSVKNIDEVFNWVQYGERGFWVEIDHPKTGPLTYARSPFIMSETPTRVGRAPLLGEHNEEIYCERLGYSREDLVKLRGVNVI